MTRRFDRTDGAEMLADDRVETRIVDLRELVTLDTDPDRQASLRRILVEEVDKLAKNRERLENCDRLAASAGTPDTRGRRRPPTRLNGPGSSRHTRKYQRTLDLMEAIQQLFENFHRRLLTKYPYSVKLRDKTVAVCATFAEARRRAQRFAVANPEAVVTVIDASKGRTRTWHPKR